MKLSILPDKVALGCAAAEEIAQRLNKAVKEKGEARLVLSTGMSQFETLAHLVRCSVPWEKVTMFHLDEYVGIPETHKASFRKYLKERFVEGLGLGRSIFVDGEGDLEKALELLTREIRQTPVDVGVIGIGENAHIAFNDPPADFERRDAYAVVTLSERCRAQQVGEGWFASDADVPRHAISMTPWQIMQCACIISPVPRAVKAEAVHKMLSADRVDPDVPASLLRTHRDFHLFLDADSAALCDPALLAGPFEL